MISTFPYFKERVKYMDAMVYFEAADLLLEGYKEIPYYDAVFEDVAEDEAKNSDIEQKSENLIRKGINALKQFIARIRKIVDDILAYFKSDAETKSAYQQFLKNVKDNPEFAGKKVTFKDYEEIAQAYSNEIAKEEEQYRKLKDEEAANKPSLAKDISEAWDKAREKLPELGKAAVKEVTVQYLLESAKRCQTMAGRANTALRIYEQWIGDLENALGKKEARKVKWKMKMLNCRFKIVRKLAGGKEKEYLTWKDAAKNIFSVSSGTDIVKRNKGAKKFVHGVTKAVKDTGLEVGRTQIKGTVLGKMDAEKDKKRLKKLEKNHEKDIKKLNTIMSDNKLRPDQKEQAVKVEQIKRGAKYHRL
jgi:hypothetical protein